jgi:hypothetical protein
MQKCLEWEADETIAEFMQLVNMSVRIRSLIVEDGFTEVAFRNPTTSEERVVVSICRLSTKV